MRSRAARDKARIEALLGRFGDPFADGESSPCGSTTGSVSPTSSAGSMRKGSSRRHRAPGPDARRRLPREDGPIRSRVGREAGPRGGGRRGRADPGDRAAVTVAATQVGAVAGRSVRRTLRQPAMASRRSSSRSCSCWSTRRPQAVDRAARVPDRLVPRVRSRGAVHPGRALRDDERRDRPRARHPDGLPQSALADVAPRIVAPCGHARRDRRAGRRQAIFYVAVGLVSASTSPRARAGRVLLVFFAALVVRSASARSARSSRSARGPGRPCRRCSRSSSSSSSSRR